MTAGISPQPNVLGAPQRPRFPPVFWLLVVATGLGSGLAAGLLMTLLRVVQHVAWSYRAGSFLAAVEAASWPVRVLVPLGAGLLVALCVPLLGRLPADAPSELEAMIWFRDGQLPPLKTLAKATLSIVIVGLGASLGREAAPKQLGTLVGSLLAQTRTLPPTQRRLLAACGAGAGIAAVYDVPFGGALFALEVLLGTLALPLVAPVFLATLTGTAAYWLFFPDAPTYHVPAMPLTAGLAVFAVVAAPVAGAAAALFVKLIAATAVIKARGRAVPPAALLVFVALGALAIPFPQLLGNGKDVVEQAALGAIALPVALALLLLKPVATAACLGAAAPGGLFTPTIAFGALLGAVLGALWSAVWPGTAPGAAALIGAGAVLAATTKGPISAVVLMMELTRHLDGLLVPMLCAVAIATAVAHRIEPRSIYTSRLGSAATIPETGTAVSAAAPLSDLLRLTLRSGAAVEIVDAEGQVIGTVERDDLLTAADALAPLEIATAIDIIEVRGRPRLKPRSPRDPPRTGSPPP